MGRKKEFLEKKYTPDSYPRKRSMNKSLIDHNDRPENLMFNRVRKKSLICPKIEALVFFSLELVNTSNLLNINQIVFKN